MLNAPFGLTVVPTKLAVENVDEAPVKYNFAFVILFVGLAPPPFVFKSICVNGIGAPIADITT